ncbi:4'-phosphopantetheinyl transferase superfamily protein [Synechococcus sp. PCC 7336]|uniref:4'-phosphopantetheinyl transferase family protein n=1 Tax=Synechococcus sp. PCC 7336 TaxID=195250 RepID=UPI00034D978D|nr:4'-phosphopantetheinyl transferase superfamily protein [Synechococcus sp. PCC 7336]
MLLLAFSCDRDIGIDVEHTRTICDEQVIAKQFFAPREKAVLQGLLPQQRQRAFFHCWTRKEAYIKALGGGLSIALDSFEVTLLPNEPAQLLKVAGHTVKASDWSMADLDIHPDYVAALAVKSPQPQIYSWTAPIETEIVNHSND